MFASLFTSFHFPYLSTATLTTPFPSKLLSPLLSSLSRYLPDFSQASFTSFRNRIATAIPDPASAPVFFIIGLFLLGIALALGLYLVVYFLILQFRKVREDSNVREATPSTPVAGQYEGEFLAEDAESSGWLNDLKTNLFNVKFWSWGASARNDANTDSENSMGIRQSRYSPGLFSREFRDITSTTSATASTSGPSATFARRRNTSSFDDDFNDMYDVRFPARTRVTSFKDVLEDTYKARNYRPRTYSSVSNFSTASTVCSNSSYYGPGNGLRRPRIPSQDSIKGTAFSSFFRVMAMSKRQEQVMDKTSKSYGSLESANISSATVSPATTDSNSLSNMGSSLNTPTDSSSPDSSSPNDDNGINSAESSLSDEVEISLRKALEESLKLNSYGTISEEDSEGSGSSTPCDVKFQRAKGEFQRNGTKGVSVVLGELPEVEQAEVPEFRLY